jgi:hypothetical protein
MHETIYSYMDIGVSATPDDRRTAGLSWRSGRDAKKAKSSKAGGAPAPNSPPSTPAAAPDATRKEVDSMREREVHSLLVTVPERRGAHNTEKH